MTTIWCQYQIDSHVGAVVAAHIISARMWLCSVGVSVIRYSPAGTLGCEA